MLAWGFPRGGQSVRLGGHRCSVRGSAARLRSLEAQLKPTGQESLARDLFVAGLLLGLAFLLVPAWESTLPTASPAPLTNQPQEDVSPLGNGDDAIASSYRRDVIGQMASAAMLAALGFLLALRQGAIDLSLWAVMGVGGVVAAWLINSGMSAWGAILLAGFLGAGVGLINALFVAGLRLPSPLVTLLVGLGLIFGVGQLVESRDILVRPDAFDGWVRLVQVLLQVNTPAAPLLTMRMVLVAVAWAGVLGVLLARYHLTLASSNAPENRRPALLAALVASGTLAGLAGGIYLLDQGYAPVPSRPIDDLVIPAAAILAGAAVLLGRGRTILACICLPVAVLMVKLWRQVAPPIRIAGLEASVLILAAMVVGLHLAVIWAISAWRARRQVLPIAAAGVMVAGLGLAAGGLRLSTAQAWETIKLAMVIWAAGAVLSLATVVRALLRRRTQAQI